MNEKDRIATVAGSVPLTTTQPRIAVAGWAALWFAGMSWRGGTSWHWFVQGQQELVDLDDRVAGGLAAGALAAGVPAPARRVSRVAPAPARTYPRA